MNIGLGLLVEVVAFLAAAYVVVALRPRLPQQTADLVLGSVGCAIGAGALLFQQDVSLVGGVLAPLFAAALLVAHVRVWDAVGVTLPAWVKSPRSARRRAYAIDPVQTQMIEEPVQQPNLPRRSQSRHPGSIPNRLPDDEPFPGEERARPAARPVAPEAAVAVHGRPGARRDATPTARRAPDARRGQAARPGLRPEVLADLLLLHLPRGLSGARDHLGHPVRERRDRLAGAAPRHIFPSSAALVADRASSAPAARHRSRSTRDSSSRGCSSAVASGS